MTSLRSVAIWRRCVESFGTCPCGTRSRHCLTSEPSSRSAWAKVTPGASRPTRYRKCEPRFWRLAGSSPSGSHTCARASCRSKSGGAMPTMVVACPLISTVRPMMPGSPAKPRDHSSCESTATGSEFGRSSASENARPPDMRARSTPNMLAVTNAAFTRSGRVPSLRFTAPVV